MTDESTGESDENEEIENEGQSPYPSQKSPKIDDNVGIDDDDSEIGGYTQPDEVSKPSLDKDEIKDFFQKKGAVEILAQLSDGPKRFSEINSTVVASHGTVATRLTEGAKLRIWDEYFRYPDDGAKTKLYELNPVAESLAHLTEEENIRETTEQLRKSKERHTDAVTTVQDKMQALQLEGDQSE
jgi:DNA-binding HxlR family transcriptional regulator